MVFFVIFGLVIYVLLSHLLHKQGEILSVYPSPVRRLLERIRAIIFGGKRYHIFRFLSDTSREQFRKEDIIYYAVVKNIEIIGEASNMLTKELREAHPEIEWAEIIGMRHVFSKKTRISDPV